MSDYGTNKKTLSKEVNYLGRDFTDIRENLIEFAKSYFPNQYNDFNEASPGMMFVEMAAYVGDVLNFYVDQQYREMMLPLSDDRRNLITLAKSYGYKTKAISPAYVEITVKNTIPAYVTSFNHGFIFFSFVLQDFYDLWAESQELWEMFDDHWTIIQNQDNKIRDLQILLISKSGIGI